MMIWVLLIDYARRMHRLTIDISWMIDSLLDDVTRRLNDMGTKHVARLERVNFQYDIQA